MTGTFARSYKRRLQESLAEGRRREPPQTTRYLLIVLVVVGLYLVAAAGLVSGDTAPDYHFVEERGAVTVLSAVMLAMGSAFALASFLVSTEARRHRAFWLVMAAVLCFLAMDELLGFHERIGRHLHSYEALNRVTSETPLRKWNDAIVLLYGVLAIPVGLYFLPSVLRFPGVLRFLVLAACLYVVHTGVDSLVEPPTTASSIAEESAKTLCGAMLAFAMLVGLLGEVPRVGSGTARSMGA